MSTIRNVPLEFLEPTECLFFASQFCKESSTKFLSCDTESSSLGIWYVTLENTSTIYKK